ncbi:MAG TPA: Fe-S cluster assembly ATPase SufC [Gammaproteobacteria bacterium]|nr:Fe-S cluster assembly ATPase SufC [Gammaproteobacteria bacterium]
MSKILLEIQDLHVGIHDNANNDPAPLYKAILQDFNLTIRAGEVHALMGPNGSGKSTLANLLARKEGYVVKQGAIRYLDEDLLALSPEECAWKGLFLGFQYPVSIPGVTNIQFLKSAFNAVRKAQGKPPMDAVDFLAVIKEKMAFLEMPEALLYRSLNDGFSGGEKKRNEILQMSLLEPKLAILDETDSGLDIDALKEVARGINALRSKDRAILLITHYQRLLDYIEPDFVHVIANGKLVKSGDKFLALELERKGYGWV